MAKKIEPTNSNLNTNHNTNNNTNHFNIVVEQAKTRRAAKPKSIEKPKPNWIFKAFIIALIGLTISLIGYYVKHNVWIKQKPAVIDNSEPAINGEKIN